MSLVKTIRRVSLADEITNSSLKQYYEKYQTYLRTRTRTRDAVDDWDRKRREAYDKTVLRFAESFEKIKHVELTQQMMLDPFEIQKIEANREVALLSEGIQNNYHFLKDNSGKILLGLTGLDLGIGAFILDRKSKTQLNEAYATESKAKAESAILDTEIVKLDYLRRQTKQLSRLLRTLKRLIEGPLSEMEQIVTQTVDWNAFTLEQRQTVAAAVKLVQLIQVVIHTPALNAEGQFSEEGKNLLKSEIITPYLEEGDR